MHELKEGDHVDLLVSIPVDMPGASRSSSGLLGGGGSGPSGANVVAAPDTLLLPKRSVVKPLVQDGVVVSPVTARMVPVTNNSLMNGATTRNTRVEEIVLAVAPAEVAPLDEAMDLKHQITCVARSGRPAAAAASAAARPARGTSQGGVSQILAALGKAFLGKDGAAAPGKAAPPLERTKTTDPTKSQTPAKDRLAMDITPGLNPMADIRFMEVMIGAKRQFVLFNGPGNSPVVTSQEDGTAKANAAATPREEENPKSE